jgi:hypothetical protein
MDNVGKLKKLLRTSVGQFLLFKRTSDPSSNFLKKLKEPPLDSLPSTDIFVLWKKNENFNIFISVKAAEVL